MKNTQLLITKTLSPLILMKSVTLFQLILLCYN